MHPTLVAGLWLARLAATGSTIAVFVYVLIPHPSDRPLWTRRRNLKAERVGRALAAALYLVVWLVAIWGPRA
jgi:hypothetical protein